MKFIILTCLVAYVQASSWSVPAAAPAILSTGTSTSSRTQDAAGNYAFSYNEQHSTGGSSRAESGNGWGSQGSYTLNVGDGRQRVVKYVADGAGFRAAIATNEPGTAALPAASTAISSPYAPPAPVAPLPVPVAVAPAPIAIVEPAPIAVPALAPALPALALPAPEPVALAPVVKAVPAVSSYSTSINHVAPAAIAAPVAVPALPALSVPAPAPVAIAAPAPIAYAPRGWN